MTPDIPYFEVTPKRGDPVHSDKKGVKSESQARARRGLTTFQKGMVGMRSVLRNTRGIPLFFVIVPKRASVSCSSSSTGHASFSVARFLAARS